jgi:hypothetical protein
MDQKLSIRPVIEHLEIRDDMSAEEKFQNATLRPIIKMQHDLILAFFQNYLLTKKLPFINMDLSQKRDLIRKIFQNDARFKTELRGMIIGQFTTEEYNAYLEISRDANKRLVSMIEERILSFVSAKTMVR